MKKLFSLLALIVVLSSCNDQQYIARSVVGNNKGLVTSKEDIFKVGDTVWVSRRQGEIRTIPNEQQKENAVFMKMIIIVKR